jgi:hypothetical protein
MQESLISRRWEHWLATLPPARQMSRANMRIVRRWDCQNQKNATFPQRLYDEAQGNGWADISAKNDWKRIFAFDE